MKNNLERRRKSGDKHSIKFTLIVHTVIVGYANLNALSISEQRNKITLKWKESNADRLGSS